MFKRTRYQFGWLRRKSRKRGPDVWVWVYRSTTPVGKRKENSVIVGSVQQYPSKADAWKAAEGLRLSINNPSPAEEITFGAVIDRYIREAIPKRRVTQSRYRSWLKNHIKPHWGNVSLAKVKPLSVEKWIESLNLAPKSRGHVRSMMHVLFNWAMRWELIPFQINPMNLVHIKGSSKREREPRTLTIEEFRRFIEHVSEPFRTMCIVTACLGLRVSETLGLKWGDFDWDDLRVKIQRSWVAGVEDDVKTLYSKKWMPVDPILAELLLKHKARTATGRERHRLGLCQSGDWKTVLARTPAGTSSSSGGKSGQDRAHRLAHISSHVFDSSPSVRCGREGAARIAAPR